MDNFFGSDNNKGSKEYTKEERELIWFGIGLGMAVLNECVHLPKPVLIQAVDIVRESMIENIPSMKLSDPEMDNIKSHPSDLWKKDYSLLMKGVVEQLIIKSDIALDHLVEDGEDVSKMGRDERLAYEALIRMKKWLQSKGYSMNTHEELVDSFSKLSDPEREELRGIMDKGMESLGLGRINDTPTNNKDLEF